MNQEAYDLGVDAANDYKFRSANPYKVGTQEYSDWDQGWHDAHDDLLDHADEDEEDE